MYSNKQIAFGILVSATVLLASCGGGKPNYKASIKTDSDSASYYVGLSIGASMASMDFDEFNIDAMAKGVQESLNAGSEVDQQKMQEIQMYLNQYFTALQTKASQKELKAGQEFLQANKTRQGVVTLPSGVQYEIIKEGTGAKPAKEDQVDVVYHGTLIDGTVFDSSKERGDTATLPVNGVVPGFSEALTLMNEGSVWKVYIPSELGYGERGAGGQIKPNSVITFEIDLVKVKKQEPAETK
jgi:FKBP-type peptidyl-prolyl cis-trans isomerase FklB